MLQCTQSWPPVMAMALVQCSLLLHSCTFTLLRSSYGDAHPPSWLLSPSPSNNFFSQSPSLVLTWFFLFDSPPLPLVSQAMPRLRGKPKRGSLWYQNRVAMASRHPPSFAPSHNSSPSSSTQSSPDQADLPPLSSPWACPSRMV
jgi:hypothetical protein